MQYRIRRGGRTVYRSLSWFFTAGTLLAAPFALIGLTEVFSYTWEAATYYRNWARPEEPWPNQVPPLGLGVRVEAGDN